MADPHHPHHATDEADADANAYLRGSMEINEQTATWTLVMNLMKWGSLLISAALLMLVLWFQKDGSFITGALAGGALLVVGILFLRSGAKSH
ncbi:MAG: aa3-type cytochrome c oxidase subunit IV [Alphaproteobacteria bacterium]|nr:MAG: aa3-type cytochrome c oxidase subunit IV [Alphaproteobacteria bacterium]